MRLIDADALLEGIAELKQSPWFNDKYGYADRKEAVETIEDLCIKKEPTVDAVERIEYEKMKDLAEQYKFEYECVLEAHKEVLNEVLPKRVEVVRCKDCKWYDNIGCALIIVDEEDRPKPDDYCSYGERKKNE